MIVSCFFLVAHEADLSLLGAQESISWEVQRYDGWYNNLLHHSHGSVGECLGMGMVGWDGVR